MASSSWSRSARWNSVGSMSFDGVEQPAIEVAGGEVGRALGAVVGVPVVYQTVRQVRLAGASATE